MLATRHITLTDATLQEVFAVPSGFTAILTYIFVANHGVSTDTVDLYWDKASVPQVYIFDGSSLQAGERLTLGGQSASGLFVLHEGETVQAQAGSAGNMEVAVTFNLEPNDSPLLNFNQ